MPLPTMPAVMRCAIRATAPGVNDEIINVIHVGGVTGAGQENIVDAALQPNWADFAKVDINADWNWQDVTYTRLDGSASVIIPWSAAQPTNTSQGAGSQTAICVGWRSALGGRRHRGRSFIGGIGINRIDGTVQSHINAGVVIATETRGTTLISAMATATYPLVVASYVSSTFQPVVRCKVNPLVCTQRRRANNR